MWREIISISHTFMSEKVLSNALIYVQRSFQHIATTKFRRQSRASSVAGLSIG